MYLPAKGTTLSVNTLYRYTVMNLPINKSTNNPSLVKNVKSLKTLKDCLKGAELMGLTLTDINLRGEFPDYETTKQAEERAVLNEWLSARGESLYATPCTGLYGLHSRVEALVLKPNYLLLTYTNGAKVKLLIGDESIVRLEFN